MLRLCAAVAAGALIGARAEDVCEGCSVAELETASLVQRSYDFHGRERVAALSGGIPGIDDILSQATGALGSLSAATLTQVATQMDTELAALQTSVQGLADRAAKEGAALKDEMATTLARTFDVPPPKGAAAGEGGLAPLLEEAVAGWQSLSTSLQAVGAGVGAVVPTLGGEELAARLNSTVQGLLRSCAVVIDDLSTVQATLAEHAEARRSSAALLQQSVALTFMVSDGTGALGMSEDVHKIHSAVDPAKAVATLNSALDEAAGEADSVDSALSGYVTDASDGILSLGKGKLSDEDLAKVSDVFKSVAARTKSISGNLGASMRTVTSGLKEGVSLAAAAAGVKSAAAPRCGAAAVLVAAAAWALALVAQQ